jgi:hypothetical protein
MLSSSVNFFFVVISVLVSTAILLNSPFSVFGVLQTLDWDAKKTHLYHCHVSLDGKYSFKVCMYPPFCI